MGIHSKLKFFHVSGRMLDLSMEAEQIIFGEVPAKMRKALVFLLITLMVATLMPIEVLAASKKSFVVGASTWSRRFVFYREVEAGMKEAALKYGIKLLTVDPNGDLVQQTAQVEDFISQKVDLISLVPIDSKASVSEIQMANKAGIPVITSDIAATGGGNVVAHIASDNKFGGRLAGEYMAKLLHGKGKVVIINYPFITSVIEREEGFKEVIKKYPGIEIVAVQSGDSKRDKAMSVMENLLQAHPDLDGVFTVNDMMGLGALQAVQAAGKNVAIIGFDANDEAIDAMKKGTPYKASVAQKPRELGRLTIETAWKILNGEKVPASIPVPVELVTADMLKK